MKRFMRLLLLLSTVGPLTAVAGGTGLPVSCGTLETHYGPFDYNRDKDRLPIVEKHHFTGPIESLSLKEPAADIAYTLHAFPNHPRALLSLIRLGERDGTDQPKRLDMSIVCYMLRAEVFAPGDATVWMISGIYSLKQRNAKLAVEKLEKAEQLGSGDPNVDYNLGLAYFELGKREKALDYAHRAMAKGFPLPGLRNKLKRVGAWRDPR